MCTHGVKLERISYCTRNTFDKLELKLFVVQVDYSLYLILCRSSVVSSDSNVVRNSLASRGWSSILNRLYENCDGKIFMDLVSSKKLCFLPLRHNFLIDISE